MMMQKLFSMRTDTDEGAEFLAALDRLRLDHRPALDRTAMVKLLVFEADAKLQRVSGIGATKAGQKLASDVAKIIRAAERKGRK